MLTQNNVMYKGIHNKQSELLVSFHIILKSLILADLSKLLSYDFCSIFIIKNLTACLYSTDFLTGRACTVVQQLTARLNVQRTLRRFYF